jgi:NitT/TauT family transport system ATP-binding protein
VLVQVEHLAKTYGAPPNANEALRDVTFTVAEHELVTIVGPSGAGKTTLLRCLAGLLAPSSGSVRVNGRTVVGPPPEVALVFQDYTRALMPWYTVGKNVALPLRSKVSSKQERRARAEEALRNVGLEEFKDRHPWQLSGGMQQRVALARGLAYQPDILLMDEPFASVDAQTRTDLEDLVLRVQRSMGLTILFVTHDIDEAVYMADRVVVLSNRPTVVADTIEVDLPPERDQIMTKSDARFAELRARVMRLIIREKPDDPRAKEVNGDVAVAR